jgi:hypothetical protein
MIFFVVVVVVVVFFLFYYFFQKLQSPQNAKNKKILFPIQVLDVYLRSPATSDFHTLLALVVVGYDLKKSKPGGLHPIIHGSEAAADGEQRSCSPSCRILNRFASDQSRISHKKTGSQIWQMTTNTETSKCAIVASEKRRRQPMSTPQEESDSEGHQRQRARATTTEEDDDSANENCACRLFLRSENLPETSFVLPREQTKKPAKLSFPTPTFYGQKVCP